MRWYEWAGGLFYCDSFCRVGALLEFYCFVLLIDLLKLLMLPALAGARDGKAGRVRQSPKWETVCGGYLNGKGEDG